MTSGLAVTKLKTGAITPLSRGSKEGFQAWARCDFQPFLINLLSASYRSALGLDLLPWD